MFDAQSADTNDTESAEEVSHHREFTPDGMTLFLAGMSYAKKGGTLPEFKRIIARLLVEANLDDDAEACSTLLENASKEVPFASSPRTSGSDLSKIAQMRQQSDATSARPAHVPDYSVKTRLAKTLLDRFKLSDGRALVEIRPREFGGYKRDAAKIEILEKHLGKISPKQTDMTVGELIGGFSISVQRKIEKELSNAA